MSRPVEIRIEKRLRHPVERVFDAFLDPARQLAMDPTSGEVGGDFVNWEYPHLWVYKGAVEADGKLHLRSRGPSFDVEGEETDYEDVLEILSPNARRLTGRLVGPDGQWRDFMVTNYRRKG